jgi:hypothetical protein
MFTGEELMLICNLTKRQYLNPEVFGEEPRLKAIAESWQGSMTGLTVLLADGNNRGGGDLRVDHALIGSWAGDEIAILDDSSALAVTRQSLREIAGTWKDLSADIIAVINQGEDWTAGSLDATSVIPAVWQRRCLECSGKPLLASNNWTMPLLSLTDLFAIFGQRPAVTPGLREKRLQEGLDELSKLLRTAPAYKVQQLTLKFKADGSGVDRALLEVKPLQGGTPQVLPLQFAASPGELLNNFQLATTPADVLQMFFPVLEHFHGRLNAARPNTSQGA